MLGMNMLDENTVNLIKQTIEQAIANKELAGANMMIIKNNKEIFYHEDGFANIKANKLIKRNTLFRLYSMTKPITAVAVIKLMEEGKLDLFDPVDKFIDTFKNQEVFDNNKLVSTKRPMVIMDLLNMTSGLVYGGDNVTGRKMNDFWESLDERLFSDQAMTTIEAMKSIGEIPLAFHPGDAWEYGVSADVLGAIVEIVSGKSYGEYLNETIFKPLDMHDTGFYVPKNDRNRLATTYERVEGEDNTKLVVYDGNHLGIINAMDRKPSFESGGAGLVSTIDDYKKFTQMLMAKGSLNGVQILKKRSVDFLISRKLTHNQQIGFDKWFTLSGHTYGNLMRVVTDVNMSGSISSQGEYGWDGWLGAYFANCPQDKLTILFMMQTKDSGTTTITRKLRNIILGELGHLN